MNDFEYQLGFVIDSAWRMVEMQDRNRLSPSYGCFHYAYWRDKTSEFPDSRFQEAGAALGLLALPRFDEARAAGTLPEAGILYSCFAAGIQFWESSQYPEGCWDEWYKGERGFAATEFPMIAYGLAARYMRDSIEAEDHERLVSTMRKAGDWLAARDDRVKANHEAAAAAALALAWETTGIETFRTAAQEKMADTLSRQTEEGWFPEIGGMDLGYCSVLLDYVMVYVLVTNDTGPIAAMKRLVEFMIPHVHPDATISPESGLCLNPIVSRLGIGLLSQHGDENAAAIVETFTHSSPGRRGLTPYLADDLRLMRWSYLPIITVMELETFRPAAGPESLSARYPEGWTIRDKSAVASYHAGPLHVYFSIAGGGAVRIFDGHKLVCEDIGINIIEADKNWGSAGYSLNRPILLTGNGTGFETAMGEAAFFYPGFLSRLVLRLGSTTPLFSRLLRQLIDRYRIKNGTAINQSAAPLAANNASYIFTRNVSVDAESVSITDRIERRNGLIHSESLQSEIRLDGDTPPPFDEPFAAATVTIMKRLRIDGTQPAFSSQMEHC